MIKKIIILILILSCKSIYAQHFSFNFDGIQLEFDYQIKDQQLKQRVLLKNTSEYNIFIPVLVDSSLYFFALQKSVYSLFGIKNSVLGAPNLGGNVLLKEIKGGQSIKFDVVLSYKEPFTEEYTVAFDYIKDVDFKKRKTEVDAKKNIMMNAEDYLSRCKSFYFLSNPLKKE